MKKIFSILLVIILISQTFINVGIGVYYCINKEYISQKLCENKNNPSMHCNGHCYLTKQLKKAEENEKRQSQSLKEKEEQVLALNELTGLQLIFPSSFIGFAKPYQETTLISPWFEIAPPPEAAA